MKKRLIKVLKVVQKVVSLLSITAIKFKIGKLVCRYRYDLIFGLFFLGGGGEVENVGFNELN